jgi:hypothetical protein
MKALITIVIFATLYFLGRGIYREFQAKQAAEDRAAGRGAPPPPPTGEAALPGLPDNFAPSLEAAQNQGAGPLKAWLDRYSRYVQDPRLAAIQLDYVVLVSRDNPREAKKVFEEVKARIPANSPLAERIKRLAKTYE